MNGIENITAKILRDAQEELARLNGETEAKVREVETAAQAQADRETADLLARGEKAAAERLERLRSAAQMEKRKLTLAAKQEVVGEAFDLALDKLCSLPDKEYVALLTRLVLQASTTGREQIVFSVKDRARVGKQVVVAANEELSRGVAPGLPNAISDTKMGAFLGKVVNTTAAMVAGTGMLTLSEETRPIRGGFILVDGDVEVNCAFETLIRLQREGLEREVARALFE